MSYVSLLKNVPEILSQPTGIAAIASLGLHGAIALIVPLMPLDSSKSKDIASSKTTVGLMELSPSDQNRLPQTANTSQVALQQQLPPQPQQSLSQQLPPTDFGGQTTTFPPLPSAPLNKLVLSPTPESSANYPLPSLPRGQSLRLVPRYNLKFDNSNLITSRKFSSSVSPFNSSDLQIRETQPLPLDRLPQVTTNNKLSENLPNSMSPNPADMGDNAFKNGQTGDNTSKISQNQPLVAPVGQPPQSTDKLALAGPRLPQLEPGSIKNLSELPINGTPEPSSKLTGRGEEIAQATSYIALKNRVQQEYPNAKQQAVIRDTISTDKPGLEGSVWGVLVVDADGKALDIKFPDRSISPELQSRTREYFNTNPRKGGNQISAYPFNLRFQNGSSKTPETSPEQKPSLKKDPQPLSAPQNNVNPATSSPSVTPKPSATPEISGNQVKPSSTPAFSSNQPAPQQPVIVKPLSTPAPSNSQAGFRTEQVQKLMRRLNSGEDKPQNSNQ